MATSSTACKEIIWSWKSNRDPFDKNQKAEWKCYSDLQADLMEEKYQNKEKSVALGDYIIDFKQLIQYKKDDENRQRPIKREGVDTRQCLRGDRFCIAEKPKQISKSFGEPGVFFESAKLIDEWKKRYQNICSPQGYSKVVEQAAQGIVHEAHLLKKDLDGKLISNKLLKVKHENQKKIHDCCVYIYSLNSFLYSLVNVSLRDEDLSKIDTLGAYCYLLTLNLYDDEKEDSTLYRGCKLPDDIIEDYRKAVGRQIIWSAFTSLSRLRKEAEKFAENALFFIRLTGNVYCSKDIANLSKYSYEQEVLLRPVHPMWIVKFDYDKEKKDILFI